MAQKYRCNLLFNEYIFGEEKMRTREDKRMVKHESFKTSRSGHILKDKLAHSLFGAWSFPLVHIRFTSNEGPQKAL